MEGIIACRPVPGTFCDIVPSMKMRALLFILLSVALSACAPKHLSPPYHYVLPAVRQTQLSALSDWDIQGSFSLQQPGQSVVANYRWLQRGEHYDLQIRSSLNWVSVVIEGDAHQVSLQRSATQTVWARTPEALMQAELGWQLPISNLQYWIRGLPAPGPYEARYDAYGHLSELKQQGWIIQYEDYKVWKFGDMPSLLRFSNEAWKAKIRVKHWEF